MRNVGHQRHTRSAGSDRQHSGGRRTRNAPDDRANSDAIFEAASLTERGYLAPDREGFDKVSIGKAFSEGGYEDM